jgi:hypothetical protein
MQNPFFYQSEICRSSGMNLEANMYQEIGEYLQNNGKELTLLSLNACIDNSKHECESWSRLFFRGAISLIQ